MLQEISDVKQMIDGIRTKIRASLNTPKNMAGFLRDDVDDYLEGFEE